MTITIRPISKGRLLRSIGLAAGASIVAVLAACAAPAPQPTTPSTGEDAAPTAPEVDTSGSSLAAIQARGVVNIGVGLTTPPFGLKDASGNPAGFDIDLANAFAEYLGVEANLFEVSADARIPTLQSGQADVISFTLTITPELAEQVDFAAIGAINAFQGVAVGVDSSIQSIDELADKVIAVQKGTIGENLADAAFPNATKQYYDTQVATLLAVQQGQADATIDGAFQLAYKVKDEPSMRMIDGLVDGDEISSYAMAVQKGNSTLLEALNAFMVEFHEGRQGSALYEKWFGVAPSAQVFSGLED